MPGVQKYNLVCVTRPSRKYNSCCCAGDQDGRGRDDICGGPSGEVILPPWTRYSFCSSLIIVMMEHRKASAGLAKIQHSLTLLLSRASSRPEQYTTFSYLVGVLLSLPSMSGLVCEWLTCIRYLQRKKILLIEIYNCIK